MALWDSSLPVAGTTFHLKDVLLLQSDKVYCEREPTNEYDSNAVAVYNVGRQPRFKIGYLPRAVAAQIQDKELPCWGKIVWVSAPPQSAGVRIEI